jgi:hypothetical protein
VALNSRPMATVKEFCFRLVFVCRSIWLCTFFFGTSFISWINCFSGQLAGRFRLGTSWQHLLNSDWFRNQEQYCWDHLGHRSTSVNKSRKIGLISQSHHSEWQGSVETQKPHCFWRIRLPLIR